MSAEPQTGELSADELDELVAETIQRDRTRLFMSTENDFIAVDLALRQLPYDQAKAAMDALGNVQAAITDPLGEHFGTCFLCEEPIFVHGQPDDDCESAGDEYVHRRCGDKWRKDHPGEATGPGDDDGC